ncbi:ATP-binding protein [Pseudonocardia saturnea]
MRIRLSGSFAVEDGDGPVVVGGRKARRLLARLAAARGGPVAVDDLVADLWPGAPPRGPGDNVATLVSRLRARLGPDAVLGGRPAYRLGPAVEVDVAQAVALAAEAGRRAAAGEPALALAASRRGLDLLGDGALLAGEPAADWVDVLRREVGTVLRALRHASADAALQVGDVTSAVATARAAADADALDDRAHHLLMAAHHAAGEPDRALAAYGRLRTAMADELGADPAPRTQELYLAVLRGDAPAARRPAPARATRPAPAGRDAELARLVAAWTAAAAGTTGLVLITGEAGIGKTTLGEAVARVAAETGGLVLQARCYAAERSLLLQPVLDAVAPALRALPPAETRRLAGPGAPVLAGLLPELAGVLGEPDPARGSADLERRRTADAVRALLRAWAATRPVLLLLDDLHNAGAATVELLHYLAARPGADRLLLLATVRSEEGAAALDTLDGVATRVAVGPLPADAVALLASRAGAPRLAEDILRRTRGHTLFVVETLRGLAAGETGVPESLQAAVLARMRRVGPEVEQVLRAGAVLGAAVAPDMVAALLDLPVPDVLGRLAEAAAARLLLPAAEQYEFANDLVHEVLYATTPAPARHAYHRRAADLLTDRPEVLAGHAAAIGDRPRAARAWLEAGSRAVGRYAAADGRVLLGRALDAAGPGDPALAGRILLARGLALLAVGEFGLSVADLDAALAAARTAGDRRLEMDVLRHLAGDVTSALGLSERARRLQDAVHIAVELDDRAAQADLYGWQAVVATNRLRFSDAIALGERAVAAGRASGSEAALAGGLDGLKTAYAYLGDPARLGPVLAELEPLLRRRGDLRLLYWVVFESALPLVASADWDRAAERISAALEINRRSGLTSHTPWLVAHQGWVERLRGHHDHAVDLGRRAVELAAVAEHRWWRVTANAMLATTLLELGRVDGALALLRDVRAEAEQGGIEAYLLRCLAPLAEATGDADVLATADALLAAVDAPPGHAWLTGGDAYLSVARAWLARGEPARARSVLAPFRAAADRQRWVPWQAAAALVDGAALAALGDHAAAEAAHTRAAALARRHDMPHLAPAADRELR